MSILEKIELGDKIAEKLLFVANDYLDMLDKYKPNVADGKYTEWHKEVKHWQEIKKYCEDWFNESE